jgi:uncharacterized membrane protein (Fun14 family)
MNCPQLEECFCRDYAASVSSDLAPVLLPSIGSFSGAGAIGALLGYGFKKLVKVLLIVLAAITCFDRYTARIPNVRAA